VLQTLDRPAGAAEDGHEDIRLQALMEPPHLLAQLGMLLVAAIGGAGLAYALRLPLVIGYVLGGVIVSPFTPGPRVADPGAFQVFADFGVVLLMFLIGVEFSVHELLAVRRVAMVGTPIGMSLIILLVFAVGWALAWPVPQRFVIGASLSVCSTMVLLKFLQNRGEAASAHGRVVLGVALMEDLAVVAMIVLLPAAATAGGVHIRALAWAFATAVLVLGPLFWLARRAVPAFLNRVARTGNTELLVLTTIALAVGTAELTAAAGLSIALGAFLAGLLVNESEFSHDILARLTPLRDIFVAIFFASIGLLVQPARLMFEAATILVLVALVIVGNCGIWFCVIRAVGYAGRTAALGALSLAQIGEFSYVLAGIGFAEGLITASVQQAILATSLATIIINAVLFGRMRGWLSRLVPP